VHPIWLEELVRERIAGLHQAADRARRIRHIAKQPDRCDALPAAPSAQPLGSRPRPADADAPVAGLVEVASLDRQPGGANPCGQRRL
jgi:hypothetical protein